MSPGARLRIVVLGFIVRWPLGGTAWHHLQYVLGLFRLGHDVCFVEDSGDSKYCCYDPVRHTSGTDCNDGLDFAARCFDQVGLGDRWAYYDAHAARWLGPCAGQMPDRCSQADLVLNLSGVNPLRDWLLPVPARAFVDQDPAFTQIEHLTNPAARQLASQHTSFFSFGENIGRVQTGVPDDGFPWQPTRQPIVLDAWPVVSRPGDGQFTTVMRWDSHPAREYAGRRFGVKSESFLEYLNLPRKTTVRFEIAMGGAAMRDVLIDNGWAVRDPLEVTADLWSYQRYIQGSDAEFSVAKQGYVAARTGWFSDRSAAYLASGRPVVVQDTGFSSWLPTGAGVLSFSSPQEAIAAVEEVVARYQSHARVSRQIAHEYFDSDKVLSALVERALTGASFAL